MGEWRILGWVLVFLGGFVVLAGLLVLLAGRIPWLGRLPGDIHIEREGLSIHIPVVTCLLFSLLLTVILNIVLRLLRK